MQQLVLSKEILIYAKFLNACRSAGLLLLIITFVLYISGLIPSRVPSNELYKYWNLSAKDYIAVTGISAGWSWVKMLGYGDFLNFLPIVFLSAVTIICYLAIIPIFFRKKDRIYMWIAILQVLILILAASGILNAGVH